MSFAKVLGDVPGPVGKMFGFAGKVSKVFDALGITKSDKKIMLEHYKKVEKQLTNNMDIINDNLKTLSHSVYRIEGKMNKVLDGLNDVQVQL